MVVPAIPQRPARSQNIDIPAIPPRPRRNKDRSVSPGRDSYAPSPLNDPAFFPPTPNKSYFSSSLSKSIPKDVMQRPPSVNLPSVGQEGAEYAALSETEADTAAAKHTKTVPGELPLHAPKASLPASTAKSRIAAVTRTDSNTAAAVGIGKPSSEAGDAHHHGHSHLAHEVSRPGSTQQRSRPSSIYKGDVGHEQEEHGIPQIGQKSLLIPHAGDVQAPTPVPSNYVPTSPGFTHSHGEGRNHYRTKSGREVFRGPPGSYGMHGHGITKQSDPLERTWYDKHPEALAREVEGEYGPRIPMERKAYNLSSAQLNRIVHTPDIVDPGSIGTPDEEVGYLASEEYTSRLTSPRPPSAGKRRSQSYADSPLRKMSFPESQKPRIVKDDDLDDDEVIHVDHPGLQISDAIPSSMDGAEDGEVFEQPILAADEVAKRPEGQYMVPAVDIDEARHGDFLGESLSRSHSRSNSVQHSAPPLLHRGTSTSEHEHTSLEDVKEYEPLFPEDDRRSNKSKKAPSETGESHPRHQFPSKDIWEDTPDSLYYETTVQTPQIPEFSRPEAEHEPKEIFDGEEQKSAPKPTAVSKEDAKPKQQYGRDVRLAMARPSMRHRFPSQDVWEDAPDSHMHTATITPEQDSPHVPPANDSSPTDRKAPSVPDRPKPQIPARPSRPTKQSPSDEVPQARQDDELSFPKSKPPVPARPAGSKISALRGAFMTDLESRLKAGPQDVPKPEEKEDEVQEPKAPLADARKGRARGPARRRPGQSPSSSEGGTQKFVPKVSFMAAVTIWEIDEDGSVSVPTKEKSATPENDKSATPEKEKSVTPEEEKSATPEEKEKPSTPEDGIEATEEMTAT